MSIFKRGNVYWFHFLHEGQHIQKSTGQGNPRTARQIEAAFRTALVKGEVGITERRKVPTFRNAMADFLAWSQNEHRAHPRTYRRCCDSAVALLRFFGDTPLDKIGQLDVERFKTKRSNECRTIGLGGGRRKSTSKRISPACINRELSCLSGVFNFAIKENEQVRNPVGRNKVKLLKEDNQQTRVYCHAEQARYMVVAAPNLRDIATLIVEVGPRPDEVYNVCAEDVHLDRNTWYIPRGKTRAAKRWLSLTSAAREVLGRRIAEVGSGYLFPHADDPGRPTGDVDHLHGKAIKAAGIAPGRLYDFRHTYATRAVESGMDLRTLAETLGHASLAMVYRYTHPSRRHQSEAIAKLEHYNAEQRIAQAQPVSEAVQ